MSPEAAVESGVHIHRLWFAGLVAGVTAPLAYWVVVFVIELWNSGGSVTEETMRFLGLTTMFGIPLSLLVMLVFGYPLIFLLRKNNRLSALNICTGALVIGALVAVALAKAAFTSNSVHIAIPLLGGATGLFAGIVFSLVAGIPFRRIPT